MNKLSFWEAHLETIISDYSKSRYSVIDRFLPQIVVNELLSYGEKKESLGRFSLAAIGKGVGKKKIKKIRSDKIYWINSYDAPAEKWAKACFSSLQAIVRKEFFMPAKRFECHIAKYEEGSFYARHSDRHSLLPGRLITCVIYLTKCKNNSGKLKLYLSDNQTIEVSPAPGKVVLFDSGLEHEVEIAQSDRWSLTGWIRDDLVTGLQI